MGGKANLVSLFELTDTYSLTVCSDLDAVFYHWRRCDYVSFL